MSTSGQEPDFQAIRELTRIPLPIDDGYVFRLGAALYGFAYMSFSLSYAVTYLDPSRHLNDVADMHASQILAAFVAARDNWTGVSIEPAATIAAEEFGKLNDLRNDFSHAMPISRAGGEQILHRRKDDQQRKGKPDKYFDVTNTKLDDFISRLTIVTDALGDIRTALGR